MLLPLPVCSHWFDARDVPGLTKASPYSVFHVQAQLDDASSLDLALLENMLKAVSRTHDPISDGLYRLMARSDEHLQRFISRTESSGQRAALTEADDMRRHPPAQAPAEACSAFGPIARVDGEAGDSRDASLSSA